jgi:hypothetical protein
VMVINEENLGHGTPHPEAESDYTARFGNVQYAGNCMAD